MRNCLKYCKNIHFFFQFWKLSKSYVQDTFIIMLYLFFVKLSYRWVVVVKFKLVDVKSTCICYDWQVERKAVFKLNNKKKIKKYVVICFAIEALSDCSLLPVIGLGLGLWCLMPLSTINWNRQEETTDLPQVTDKLYHICIVLSKPSPSGIWTCNVVIGTDCIGSYKSNYHTITTAPTSNWWHIISSLLCHVIPYHSFRSVIFVNILHFHHIIWNHIGSYKKNMATMGNFCLWMAET